MMIKRWMIGVMIFSCAFAATATEIRWDNPAGGDFNTASNWSPEGVPGADDVMIFDLDATYTVTWSEASSVFGYHVNAGDVTWSLGNCTHTLNQDSTNNVGLSTSPASLTIADGVVDRDGGYTGTSKSFKLQGAGSRLQILGSGQYLGLYYVKFEEGTEVLVDGPGAKLSHTGYSFYIKNSVVVTHGGVWELSGGVKLYDGGDIRVSGGSTEHKLTLSRLEEGSNVLITDGADVACGYCTEQYMQGTFTLNNSTYRNANSSATTTTGEFIVYGPNAVLQGSGAIKFWSMQVSGGTVRPGGSNTVGTLEVTGGITNVTPDEGTFEFELAGTALNQYDRVVLYNDGRSNAREGFPDARWYPGGTLKVSFIDGFTPAAGDTFKILDFDSIEGTFDTLDFEGSLGKWDVSQLYVTGEITFTDGPALYDLNVINGTGDGNYVAADSVGITADPAPPAWVFTSWTGDTAYIADIYDPSTTVSMPGQVTRVTATYTNLLPLVHIGDDLMLDLPTDTVTLRGTIEDAGAFGTSLNSAWTCVSGPASVTFSSRNALMTDAQFTVAGTYRLRLTVSGSEASGSDELLVLVNDSERLTLPVVITPTPKPTAEMENYANIHMIDLQAFGIYNDGTHATETSIGINNALQNAKTLNVNRIVFPKGTYLVSETNSIVFNHKDTLVDLNGATLKINPNALGKYSVVSVDEGAENFRLTNGTIMGDKDTHTGTTGEWGHALVLAGGLNCEIDHLTLTNAWGDGLVTESNFWSGPDRHYIYTNNLQQGAFTDLGVITPNSEKTRTIEPYDMSAFGGAFEFGWIGGYQGFPCVLDREYQACFYTADMTFIQKMDCTQYKKHTIPSGATYIHLEFNQPAVEGVREMCGTVVNFKPPTHVHVHDLTIVKNRRNGLSVCGGQKMIFEDILFKENGGTAPGFGVDYEDGWELMQDIVFRHNRFDNNERGDLVVCAGSEYIFEDNVFEQGFYVWGRTHNATFRRNQVLGTPVARAGVAYRTRSGALSIHHNHYENLSAGPKVEYERDNLPLVRLFDESIYNGAVSGGYFVRADLHCDTSLSFYDSIFKDSTLQMKNAESHDNRFIGCTISNSVWNSHGTNAFTNCNILNFSTKSHKETDLISFEGCQLDDVNVDVVKFTDQTPMNVMVDDCEIVLEDRSLVTVRTDRLDRLQVTDCTIENPWGGDLIDNQTSGAAATNVIMQGNIDLP